MLHFFFNFYFGLCIDLFYFIFFGDDDDFDHHHHHMTPSEFFTPGLTDGLSLESERQQVSKTLLGILASNNNYYKKKKKKKKKKSHLERSPGVWKGD